MWIYANRNKKSRRYIDTYSLMGQITMKLVELRHMLCNVLCWLLLCVRYATFACDIRKGGLNFYFSKQIIFG